MMIDDEISKHSNRTVFITGIVIQSEGKGAWACIRETIVPRQMSNLHEKISYETSLTEEVVSLFDEVRKNHVSLLRGVVRRINIQNKKVATWAIF